MSMYHEIFLYPAEEITPSVTDILRLVNWLAETVEIKPISAENPLTIDFELNPEDNEEDDPGEHVEFATIDEQLITLLSNWSQWSIWLGFKNLTGKGPISRCFELDARTIDWSIVRPPSVEVEDIFYNETYLLTSIVIEKVKVRDYYDDNSFPDRNFAISLKTDMRLANPIEHLEDYFNLIWPRLLSSGILAEIGKILGVGLDGRPSFG